MADREAPSKLPGCKSPRMSQADAAEIIHQVCCLSGSFALLQDVQDDIRRKKLDVAVARHQSGPIFNWLLTSFSFQGISDQVARAYIGRHGNPSWRQISQDLRSDPSCPRLESHWAFDRCGYDKGSGCCSEPEHNRDCPLPTYRLRNGRLNQVAFSLYLFIRDVARGDFVEWLDQEICRGKEEPILYGAEPIIGPLRHVFGISDKLITMTLSSLLMGLPETRPDWFAAGIEMIAIDTLVHNFLHRTGILDGFDARHPYGAGCYSANGCAEIIKKLAGDIDARQFNRSFPARFPRFVQHAIWQYCSLDGLNICNGNMIENTLRCSNTDCRIYGICNRKSLI